MGGRWEKRLRGRSTLTGMSSSSSSSSAARSSKSFLSSSSTGSLVSAAVEGLMSWAAEGSLLMWAVWMVSAICMGMSDEAMLGRRENGFRPFAVTDFGFGLIADSRVHFWVWKVDGDSTDAVA